MALVSEAYARLIQSQRRQELLVALMQPMTGKQLARKTRAPLDFCSLSLSKLVIHKLAVCLNPEARRSRLYWLTEAGKACQRQLREWRDLPPLKHDFPNVDWKLYGWTCYSHRAAIIKTLDKPMQSASIKRKAKNQDNNLRMSANNVRDVMKLLLKKGIVRTIKIKKKAHPRHELTDLGKNMRTLLIRAEGF